MVLLKQEATVVATIVCNEEQPLGSDKICGTTCLVRAMQTIRRTVSLMIEEAIWDVTLQTQTHPLLYFTNGGSIGIFPKTVSRRKIKW